MEHVIKKYDNVDAFLRPYIPDFKIVNLPEEDFQKPVEQISWDFLNGTYMNELISISEYFKSAKVVPFGFYKIEDRIYVMGLVTKRDIIALELTNFQNSFYSLIEELTKIVSQLPVPVPQAPGVN